MLCRRAFGGVTGVEDADDGARARVGDAGATAVVAAATAAASSQAASPRGMAGSRSVAGCSGREARARPLNNPK